MPYPHPQTSALGCVCLVGPFATAKMWAVLCLAALFSSYFQSANAAQCYKSFTKQVSSKEHSQTLHHYHCWAVQPASTLLPGDAGNRAPSSANSVRP